VQGTYDYYVEISFNDNPDNGCNLATSQTVSFEVVSDPVLTDPLLTQTGMFRQSSEFFRCHCFWWRRCLQLSVV
jgi:hypothetical protein